MPKKGGVFWKERYDASDNAMQRTDECNSRSIVSEDGPAYSMWSNMNWAVIVIGEYSTCMYPILSGLEK